MTRRPVVVTASLVLTLFAACGDSSEKSPPGSQSAASFAGLCAARQAANAGDVAGAKASFDHGPLHALAAKAEDADRAVAANLLENKEHLESLTKKPDVDPGELAAALNDLINATRGAQRATGEPETNCESESE